MNSDRPRVGVIGGPTGSGKSSLAESLVDPCNAEIVSADALQLYRGFDIGTAKPAAADRVRYRYHGVDLLDPTERATAGQYAEYARGVIAEILSRGRLPLLVGGSGFYVDATLGSLDQLPTSEPRWRDVLEQVCERKGVTVMHAWLQRLDPERAAAIESRDRQRTLRALEIVLRAGRPVAELSSAVRAEPGYDVVYLGLDWSREELYARIDARVEVMLAAGWLEEVATLRASGVPEVAHAMQAIGYRELCGVLAGADVQEARRQIARSTRRYAKRQLTYCRRWPMHWIPPVAVNGELGSATVDAARERLAT